MGFFSTTMEINSNVVTQNICEIQGVPFYLHADIFHFSKPLLMKPEDRENDNGTWYNSVCGRPYYKASACIYDGFKNAW